jgi:hypothetical protein
VELLQPVEPASNPASKQNARVRAQGKVMVFSCVEGWLSPVVGGEFAARNWCQVRRWGGRAAEKPGISIIDTLFGRPVLRRRSRFFVPLALIANQKASTTGVVHPLILLHKSAFLSPSPK